MPSLASRLTPEPPWQYRLPTHADMDFNAEIQKFAATQVVTNLMRIEQKLDSLALRLGQQLSDHFTNPACPDPSTAYYDIANGKEASIKDVSATKFKEEFIEIENHSAYQTLQSDLESYQSRVEGQPLCTTEEQPDESKPDPKPETHQSANRSSRRSQGSVKVKASCVIAARTSLDSFQAEQFQLMEKVRQAMELQQGRNKQSQFKKMMWRFLENPYSSRAAYVYSIIVPVYVFGSTFLAFMQTVEDSPVSGTTSLLLQINFEVVFTLDLVGRLVVCPDRWAFVHNIFNYIDLLSTLPLLVRILFGLAESLGMGTASKELAKSIVSVAPILRLLKLTRRFETFQLLLSAFKVALEALPVLLYTLMLIALMFAAVIFFVEPEDNIQSLPVALWLTIVSMTTVGYGDKTPVSVAGHIAIVCLLIISALYMAIPIGIVGNAFSQVWGDRDRLLLVQRMRDAFAQGGFNAEVVSEIFGVFDEDSSGELDVQEFQLMLKTMQLNLGAKRTIQLFQLLDPDGKGCITESQMLKVMFPKAHLMHLSEDRAIARHSSIDRVMTECQNM